MKTAFVTGASAGFGKAICRQLIAEGYRVIGGARRMDKLMQLGQELGEHFIPLALDVSDKASLDKAIGQINQASLSIDVLVNNAGLALASSARNSATPRTGNG